MDNDIYHLGAWFRQVRKDRGYTLTQVPVRTFHRQPCRGLNVVRQTFVGITSLPSC
ncbi:hypothetical protein [Lacticaseibacillus sharpeae]|uniref:hypothetical protein n=1 Tax=Lacticaseibacillus sharpeae TaxID=1626 RepID=UPI000A4DA254|nr:hypothetical protein [Lacticaseibacillus sharpeae]